MTMKKIVLLIALTVATISSFAIDRKDDVEKVSYNALRQFEDSFTEAKNVSWRVTDQYVKASFSMEGKRMAAIYDPQGNYIGAVEYVTYTQIPVKARLEIERKFKDFTFTSGLKIVDRPSGAFEFNDIGTYWVDLTNDVKQLYVSVSSYATVSLHKTIDLERTAGN
jgi:hypothetical protein